MREKFMRFMQGRYGMDELSKVMVWGALIACILSYITRWSILYYISIILIVLGYVRMFSKNYSKRYNENLKYLQIKGRILGIFKKNGSSYTQNANYRIYKCPKCKQKVRVPKGKGRISITCPKCHNEFIKRS